MNWIAYTIEFIFSMGLFVNAALFIPQIIKILKEKSAKGLSLITFGGFSATQFFTILHGYIHKDTLLTIGFILSFITCGTVIICALIYRKKT